MVKKYERASYLESHENSTRGSCRRKARRLKKCGGITVIWKRISHIYSSKRWQLNDHPLSSALEFDCGCGAYLFVCNSNS